MKILKRYLLIFFAFLLFWFLVMPEQNENYLDRDHLTRIIQNEGFDCDSIVFIKRRKLDVQIGCDYNNQYKKYLVYRDDYGFNKVKVD